MAQIYEPAEAVENIARSLIPTHHPHLATARIRFLFKEKAGKKGGRVVHGTVKKMSDLMVYLIDADFLMEIGMDKWAELSEARRHAEIDRLLECCVGVEDEKTGDIKWGLREPDVQEFTTILHRHGAYSAELIDFVTVGKSIDLSYLTDSVEAEQAAETTTTAT